MSDMREPYAHVHEQSERLQLKAETARMEIIKLTAVAETCEEAVRHLDRSIHKQVEEDADREATK